MLRRRNRCDANGVRAESPDSRYTECCPPKPQRSPTRGRAPCTTRPDRRVARSAIRSRGKGIRLARTADADHRSTMPRIGAPVSKQAAALSLRLCAPLHAALLDARGTHLHPHGRTVLHSPHRLNIRIEPATRPPLDVPPLRTASGAGHPLAEARLLTAYVTLSRHHLSCSPPAIAIGSASVVRSDIVGGKARAVRCVLFANRTARTRLTSEDGEPRERCPPTDRCRSHASPCKMHVRSIPGQPRSVSPRCDYEPPPCD